MLYAGLDLSRKRLDFHLLDGEGATVERGATPPDADGLQRLSERVARYGAPVRAAIESMNGARFVHDRLELAGWQVEIADAQKVKGLAPLACKTDRIDAWVLAELARRDLVPAIWLPDPLVRAERERARWRLHLVRHRSSLKQRVHAVLLTHGKPCPVSDLFGVRERSNVLAHAALTAYMRHSLNPDESRSPRLRKCDLDAPGGLRERQYELPAGELEVELMALFAETYFEVGRECLRVLLRGDRVRPDLQFAGCISVVGRRVEADPLQ